MKLIKLLPFTVLITGLVFSYYLTRGSQNKQVTPVAEKNNFVFQLKQALETSQIKYTNLKLEDFQNQVKFTIINDNNQAPSEIIFSTQKDAVWQVASLQQILSESKIKGNNVKFIDLSIQHPYATLQNN